MSILWQDNINQEDVLLEQFKKEGKQKAHLCPDWDFMAIHSQSPEFKACLCNKDRLT